MSAANPGDPAQRSLAQSLLRVAGVTLLLLLVPAIGMQFTKSVSWGPIDFLAAGALIFLAGAAIVVARRRIAQPARRLMAVAGIVLALLLVWAELAVGLFH
ncbi:MAG TPA: hypothetical protein VHL79_12770 [Ramlibacter sp.]|nr:hypothetical protein [Ramlibacter sp.]